MIISRPEIWKTHKKKAEFNECPHCGKPLQWIYDGIEWHPCDKEPVLFILHPDGRNEIMYNRELFNNALVYRSGDKRFDGVRPMYGSIPHYFSCPVLKESRRMYAMDKKGL